MSLLEAPDPHMSRCPRWLLIWCWKDVYSQQHPFSLVAESRHWVTKKAWRLLSVPREWDTLKLMRNLSLLSITTLFLDNPPSSSLSFLLSPISFITYISDLLPCVLWDSHSTNLVPLIGPSLCTQGILLDHKPSSLSDLQIATLQNTGLVYF